MEGLEQERSRRLYNWMQGKPMPPLRINIIPTNRCNLNCLFCADPRPRRNGYYKFDKELSYENWVRVIEEGAKMGIKDWWICGGGDPMMRSDLTIAMLKIIKKVDQNAGCLLTSNGTLFTPEIIEELVVTGLDRLQCSLDGTNRKLHDFYRGVPGTFKKVTKTIKLFYKTKKRYNTDKPEIAINMVLNAKNVDKMYKMVKLAHKLKVNEIMITPMRIESVTRKQIEKNGLRMNEEQKKRIKPNFEKAKKLAQKYNIFLDLLINEGQEEILEEAVLKRYKDNEIERPSGIGGVKHPFLGLRCYEPWYTMIVDAYGNAGSCVTAGKNNDPKYNLREYTLHNLWYGNFFTKFRKRLIQNKFLKTCSHCTVTDMRNKVRMQLIDYYKNKENCNKRA